VLTQLRDNASVEFGCMVDQRALGVWHLKGRDTGREQVERSACRANVVLADRSGLYCGGQLGKFRWHLRASD
jgi:hypothetical protein